MNNATAHSWEHPASPYRVDLDHRGDWCVWQQMPGGGWTAIHSCLSHNDAVNRVARLNAEPRMSIDGSALGLTSGV
ncbi:MAG: hypothetical protein ACI89L_001343 [Phycisphaerales bacterium]|jgi:hypothetical protein